MGTFPKFESCHWRLNWQMFSFFRVCLGTVIHLVVEHKIKCTASDCRIKTNTKRHLFLYVGILYSCDTSL